MGDREEKRRDAKVKNGLGRWELQRRGRARAYKSQAEAAVGHDVR